MTENPWPTAQSVLAPRWPGQIRLCRYSGLNDRPASTLVSADTLRSSGKIRRLVGLFDALPAPAPGTRACLADDGSEIVALLAYPRHQVAIRVGLTGCNRVTNGDLSRTAASMKGNPAGPRLLAQLERLTR